MLFSMAAFAQKAYADGFYRVQNLGSGKYLYVRDCVGQASVSGTEMGAIELWSGLDNAISDPGSVIYLQSVGSEYDLTSQATGVFEITGMYMNIYNYDTYCMVYKSGMYLYDISTNASETERGKIGAKTSSEMSGKVEYRKWATPVIDSETENYFGFKPTVTAAGKYYAPFYADFAYTPKDPVKTWYVKQIDKKYGIAVVAEVTGTVARSQAVFVECPSPTPNGNKIDLTTNAGTTPKDNLLAGVFFCNGDRSGYSHKDRNPAAVPYDAKTMRMLGTNAEGKLAYVSESENLVEQKVKISNKWQEGIMCIPHNQSYLKVDEDCPETLEVMTEAEYKDFIAKVNGDNTGDNGDNTGGDGDNTGGNGDNTGGDGDNTGGNGDNTGGDGDNTGGNGDNTGGNGDNTGGDGVSTNKIKISNKIYDMTGRFVGTSVSKLPKGTYIINNRKFIIK